MPEPIVEVNKGRRVAYMLNPAVKREVLHAVGEARHGHQWVSRSFLPWRAEYRLTNFHTVGDRWTGPNLAWEYARYREALAHLDGLLRASVDPVPSLADNSLAVWLSIGAAEIWLDPLTRDRLVAYVRFCDLCEAVITDESYATYYALHRNVEDGGTECPGNRGRWEYGPQWDDGRNWYRGHTPAERVG